MQLGLKIDLIFRFLALTKLLFLDQSNFSQPKTHFTVLAFPCRVQNMCGDFIACVLRVQVSFVRYCFAVASEILLFIRFQERVVLMYCLRGCR